MDFWHSVLKGIFLAWFFELLNFNTIVINSFEQLFDYQLSIELYYLSFIIANVVFDYTQSRKKGEENDEKKDINT